MSLQINSRGHIIPPSSTDKIIVFPYNKSINKFKSYHYTPAMTYGNGNIPTEAIQMFLEDIEFHVKSYYTFWGFRLMKILLYLGYTLFLLYVISIYAGIFAPMLTEKEVISPYVWMYFGVTLVLYFIPASITYCICSALGKRKLEEANQNVQLYINERAMDFKLRGLCWILPVHFPNWIELWKTDPYPNIQHQLQPVQMYNSNEGHYSRPGETAEMMQMHSTQHMQQFEIPVHPQAHPQQPNKRGYYQLNEEKSLEP